MTIAAPTTHSKARASKRKAHRNYLRRRRAEKAITLIDSGGHNEIQAKREPAHSDTRTTQTLSTESLVNHEGIVVTAGNNREETGHHTSTLYKGREQGKKAHTERIA